MKKKNLTVNERLTSVETTLHHIMYEVAANGNKGLEPSLRDIYQMSKATHEMAVQSAAAIASFRALLQPEMDRRAFWKSARQMFKTSWFGKIFNNKTTTTLFIIIALFMSLPLLHAFGVDTAAIIAYVWGLAVKLYHVYFL